MAPSEGKKFEQDFVSSLEDAAVDFTRLYDPMGSYAGIRNICDFIVYTFPNIFYLELKSYKGERMPMTAISDKQFSGLLAKSDKRGVVAGVIINFRPEDSDEVTYFVPIQTINIWKNVMLHKSITVSMAVESGTRLFGTKKRTRYRYDVGAMLVESANRRH